jgi:Escherichia/Staphylococcus phage prohead protease
MSDLEIRAAALADVSYPKRMIELIVMPYERETEVGYQGRRITEIVSHGAFDGIQRRAAEVRVNRDHDERRPIGRTLALHPSRQDGLVAEVKISRTELGEETLILADDGILDASAGFRLLEEEGQVRKDAEVWESRDRRRLNHLFLHHIAMTPDPAYPDARVLAVRNAQEPPGRDETVAAMPNRIRLRISDWEALAAEIDERYRLNR